MNNIGEKIETSVIVKSCRQFDITELMSLLRHDMNKFWSWGSHAFTIDNKNNTKMFRMTVSGHHHKGHLYIFLNGLDLFDVYLTSNRGTIKDIIKDQYFDMLVDSIDRRIERIARYVD
jgi:hypothetical protein